MARSDFSQIIGTCDLHGVEKWLGIFCLGEPHLITDLKDGVYSMAGIG